MLVDLALFICYWPAWSDSFSCIQNIPAVWQATLAADLNCPSHLASYPSVPDLLHNTFTSGPGLHGQCRWPQASAGRLRGLSYGESGPVQSSSMHPPAETLPAFVLEQSHADHPASGHACHSHRQILLLKIYVVHRQNPQHTTPESSPPCEAQRENAADRDRGFQVAVLRI